MPVVVSPETVVVRLLDPMLAAGPLAWLQPEEAIVAPFVPVAVPVSSTLLVGNVMVWLLPALTMGPALATGGVEVTVTVTFDEELRPLLSTAVRVNT